MYLKETASVSKEPRGKGQILRTKVLKLGEGVLPEELELDISDLLALGPRKLQAGLPRAGL